MTDYTKPSSPGLFFQFWHGARKWQGLSEEIKPGRTGRQEGGPGLYLTNRLDRAKDYAKGPGSVIECHLDPQTRWLEDAHFNSDEVKEFARTCPRLKNRSRLVADLDRWLSRHPGETMFAIILVNLCVNNECLTPSSGQRLAQWLVEHDVDASRMSKGVQEDWIVVFNPAIIKKAQQHRLAHVDPQANFPTWEEQQKRLNSTNTLSRPRASRLQ